MPAQDVLDRVAAQAAALPQMFGAIDFSVRPYRFTDLASDPDSLRPGTTHERPRLLADADRVALIEAYTMLGDTVADAYAALLPELGFGSLVSMLKDACDHGVDSVPDAPPELVALIKDMERLPDWIDFDLVERGAQQERNSIANLAPYGIRGAFVGTFMNAYAALPMALTGALDHRTAATRIKETAVFFTSTALPGSLRRSGPGFKAAAMVRLMHSMVRFNILTRGNKWDPAIYGVPIPQVDQMPAGLIASFMLARKVLDSGRTEFSPEERARIEFARYRCFLLGLPEELLGDTPQEIVDLLMTRHATLRDAYDDATCGALVRATMAATLQPGEGRKDRLVESFERSFSQVFFIKGFLNGNAEKAAAMGIAVTPLDRAKAVMVLAPIAAQLATYGVLLKVPATRSAADRRLVAKMNRYLATLGRAEYATHADDYRHV